MIFWNLIVFKEENCQKRELTTIDEKIGIFVFFSIKWKMSSIFIFCHFTGKIEGKIEDGEIRGLKQMDTMGP